MHKALGLFVLDVSGGDLCSFSGLVLGKFLSLTFLEDVTLIGVFGTSNRVGMAFEINLFWFSLFLNCDSSKCFENNS